MSLGETLRLAREEKGATISQVAEATRMMAQIVEDLEREDFRRIAAPIYGRGFIKLYAEHLGLSAEPLIREFMDIYTGSRQPQVVRRVAEDLVEDGPTVRPSDRPTVEPSDRPTVPPPDRPTPQPADEPDLFSMAASRSEAVRSVPDPAALGETAPPRVRPAATRPEMHTPAAVDAIPRREPPKSRTRVGVDATPLPRFSDQIRAWLPRQWIHGVLGVMVLVILVVLIVFGVRLRRHKAPVAATPVKSSGLHVTRVLPPAVPYFD